MEYMLGGFGVFGVFMMLFLVVLAILWFFLPFAIFGTKNKLDTLIAEVQKINLELEKLNKHNNSDT